MNVFLFSYLSAAGPSSYASLHKDGAQTPIYCAVAPEVEGQDSAYWDHCAIRKPTKRVQDDEACRKLWEYSAKLVGLEE